MRAPLSVDGEYALSVVEVGDLTRGGSANGRTSREAGTARGRHRGRCRGVAQNRVLWSPVQSQRRLKSRGEREVKG